MNTLLCINDHTKTRMWLEFGPDLFGDFVIVVRKGKNFNIVTRTIITGNFYSEVQKVFEELQNEGFVFINPKPNKS